MRHVPERVFSEKILHSEFGVLSTIIQLGRERLNRDRRSWFGGNYMHKVELGTISSRQRCGVWYGFSRYLRKIGCEKDVLESDIPL